MKFIQTYENFQLRENQDSTFPETYQDLYALYLLSQEKEDWCPYPKPNKTCRAGNKTKENKYIYNFWYEDSKPILIQFDWEIMNPPLNDEVYNQKDFQEWYLQNTSLHNQGALNFETLNKIDRGEIKSSFKWCPELLIKYNWLFKTKRTGII